MLLIDFIKQHYNLVFSCLIFVFSIILCLVRKKPNKIIDTISEKIALLLPTFIRYAEDKFGVGYGLNKKQFVIDLVKEWFSDENLEFTDYYLNLVNNLIEQILSTPQKK